MSEEKNPFDFECDVPGCGPSYAEFAKEMNKRLAPSTKEVCQENSSK